MKYSSEQRGKILSQLPQEVRDAFTSERNLEHLKDISVKYNLSQEERGELGQATGFVLLGILSMKGFQERLHKKIDEPEKQINKLVREVQENIFQPIAGSLKKLDPEAILAQTEADEEKAEEEEERAENEEDEISRSALDIPVPPPPGGDGDTPSPSYGGTSDPYREPVDD